MQNCQHAGMLVHYAIERCTWEGSTLGTVKFQHANMLDC
jgi:hypothetical protein